MSVKLALGRSLAPYVVVYTRSGDTFTAQTTTPSSLGSSAAASVDWNSDGSSILVTYSGVSPYARVYNVSGSTYTEITGSPFGTLTATTVAKWNHDGSSVAIAYSTRGFVLYNRSGDTFNNVDWYPSATININGTATSLAWSADGNFLAVGSSLTTGIRLLIYSRSGDTFAWSPINTTPAVSYTNGIFDIDFNHNGSSIAFVNGSGVLQILNYTPEASPYTWTGITAPSVSSASRVAWNHLGTQLAVATQSPNTIKVYSRSGDTFTLQATLSDSTLNTQINDIEWNADSTSIAAMSSSANHTIHIWNQTSPGTFSLLTSPTQSGTYAGYSVSWVGTNTSQGSSALTSTATITSNGARTRSDSSALTSTVTTASTSERTRASGSAMTATSTVTALGSYYDPHYIENGYVDYGYTEEPLILIYAEATLTVQAFSLSDQARTRNAIGSIQATTTVIANSIIQRTAQTLVQSIATATSIGNRTRNNESNLVSTASLSATVLRIRNRTAAVTATVTVSADSDVIRSGNSTLAATVSLSALALRIQDVSSNLISTNSLATEANRTRTSAIYFVQTITVSADADRIATTSVVLSALDTVVSAAARKTGTQAQLSVVSSVSAVAGRIAGGLFDSLYRAPTGIIVDGSHHPCIVQLKYPAGSAYVLEFGLPIDPWQTPPYTSIVTDGQTIISFWAQFSGAGCIWSSVNANSLGSQELSFEYINSGFRLESQQALGGPSNWTSRVDWLSSANDGQWHHYVIQLNDFASQLVIDGELITQTGQTYIRQDTNAPTAPQWNSTVAFPINLGAKVSVSYIGGSWVYTPVYADQLTGAIAQLWIGDVYSSGSGYSSDFFAPLNDYYRLTTDETPAFDEPQGFDGYGITFSRVYFYDELDYPYLQAGPIRVNTNEAQYLTRDRLSGRETAELVRTTDWIPSTPLTTVMPGGARARFTLTGIVTKAKPGLADLTAQASLSATMTGLIQADAAIVATTTVLATSTRLNSYRASLVATATVVSQAQPIRSGLSESTVSAATVAAAGRIASGQADLTVNSTVTAIGLDQNSGQANLIVVCQLVAQDTNFTKAESRITANFALTAVGTALVPTKGEVLQVSAFNLSVDADVIRSSITNLAANFSTLTSGGLVANGRVSMLAFAVSVTAGRIVNFFDENILIVPQEQNGLIVFVEPRITNPQFENRVNTVLAEPRDIVVEQATGLLLSQFN